MIPVSVVITTLNEAQRIAACLAALKDFDEVVVVDSNSRDATASIARDLGVMVVSFTWDRQYPKKRQWCLQNIDLKHDWVFFVDADEIVTPALSQEIAALFKTARDEAGFFIQGRHRLDGKVLRFGSHNRKIALLHRKRMMFPVVDDLDIPGMGEIEGHYQPVPVMGRIGRLRAPLLHDSYANPQAWAFRHEKYARWEAGMTVRGAWPADPVAWRQRLKSWLRGAQHRPTLMFLGSYVVLGGFLDGAAGFKFAKSRSSYYHRINEIIKSLKG